MLGGMARSGFSRRRAFLVTVGIGWALYGGLGILAGLALLTRGQVSPANSTAPATVEPPRAI